MTIQKGREQKTPKKKIERRRKCNGLSFSPTGKLNLCSKEASSAWKNLWPVGICLVA
jgi:hypothetical protein